MVSQEMLDKVNKPLAQAIRGLQLFRDGLQIVSGGHSPALDQVQQDLVEGAENMTDIMHEIRRPFSSLRSDAHRYIAIREQIKDLTEQINDYEQASGYLKDDHDQDIDGAHIFEDGSIVKGDLGDDVTELTAYTDLSMVKILELLGEDVAKRSAERVTVPLDDEIPF
jgi:hypothetical protein